jgi:hypothetical protein
MIKRRMVSLAAIGTISDAAEVADLLRIPRAMLRAGMRASLVRISPHAMDAR